MFKHILVPTDGSPTALKAAKAAVRFAAETGARITAYYAIESGTPQLYGEGYGIDALSLREFERAAREAGERHVGAVTKLSAIRWGVAGRIVWAWILTIPCSAFIAALTWSLLRLF